MSKARKQSRELIAARGALDSPGKIAHADARTRRNRADQLQQRERRLDRRAEFHSNREDVRATVPVHETLGLEFLLDRSGRDLSVAEGEALMKRMLEERATYLADRGGKRAGTTRRKAVAVPLEYDSYTLAPWHSLALVYAAMEHRTEVLEHLKKGAAIVTSVIERVTGFEVVACPLHPKKFAMHFQPSWVKVDAAGQLLGTRKGLGRSGKPVNLSRALLGAWRLREAGLDLATYTLDGSARSSANLDRFLASRRAGGQEPLDLEVAKGIDAYFGGLKNDPVIGKYMTKAWIDYVGFKNDERLAVMDDEQVRAVVAAAKKDATKARKQAADWAAAAKRLAAPFAERLPFIAMSMRMLRESPQAMTPQMFADYEATQAGYKLKQAVVDAIEVLATDPQHAEQCRVIRDMHDALRGVVRGEHTTDVVDFASAAKAVAKAESKARAKGQDTR